MSTSSATPPWHIDYSSKLAANEKEWLREFNRTFHLAGTDRAASPEENAANYGRRRELRRDAYAQWTNVAADPDLAPLLKPDFSVTGEAGQRKNRRRFGACDYIAAQTSPEDIFVTAIDRDRPKPKRKRIRRKKSEGSAA